MGLLASLLLFNADCMSWIGAANRSPDSCAADPDAAHALNVTASGNLASTTSSRGIFLLYISTDYVFSGRPSEAPYTNVSPPDPSNVYGQTKLEGEKAILGVSNRAATRDESGKNQGLRIPSIVLRVPILYGPCEPSESAVNVLMSQVWASQEIKPSDPKIKIDDYAQRFPTNTEDVARVCLDICKLYLNPPTGKELPTILQFSSEDKMTKWQICEAFGEILGLPLEGLEPYKPKEEQQDGIKRPYDCHLDTTALKELGIDVSTVGFTNWWYVFNVARLALTSRILTMSRRREVRAFKH